MGRTRSVQDGGGPEPFKEWLNDVRVALNSINMPLDEWQRNWAFDFEREYKTGSTPGIAAERANRFWWHEQNKALNQQCVRSQDCWLPRGHAGECEPYEARTD